MKVYATEFLKSIPGVFGIHFDQHAPYEVLLKGDLEIRKYRPMTIASITEKGTHESAVNKAFTKLAKYIFNQDIPMTVPVFQELIPNGVTLSFYIADDGALIEPRDHDIRLQHLPERIIAAFSYSGINFPGQMLEAKAQMIEHLLKLQGYSPKGDVFWAQYDSPMTIPFLRKNEAMVELKKIS